MRRLASLMVLGCCSLVTMAYGQKQRKPGLWELTTVMTMEGVPPGAANGTPHVAQVCFAQEMINKYGAIVPTMAGCRLSSFSVKAGHMTGTMVCTGRMAGTAEAESSWSDPEHATGSIHFTGTEGDRPMNWTSRTMAVFKSPDCGAVKPMPMPPE
jgi:hypothetical protein